MIANLPSAARKLAALTLALLLWTGQAQAERIVIDPGHGGTDPGGTGTGMQEKDVVLDTSLRFRDLLEADTADTQGGGSWQVSLTRDTDVFVSLAARSAYANSINADRFMSIHANAFGTASANGTETFSASEGGQSAPLRNLVQEEMIAAWGLTNRGNKTAGFSVLVNTAMPAVLHELAFITNPTDAAKLASPAERQHAAVAHMRALQRHFGIVPYLPGAQPDPESGSLLVVVLDPASLALANAVVSIDGDQVGQSDDSGELLIEALSTGEHLVAVHASNFEDAEQVTDVVANEVGNLVFTLSATPESGNEPPGNSGACDSPSPECSPPGDDGVGGGCSSAGGTSSTGLTLLLLAICLCVSRRKRLAFAAR